MSREAIAGEVRGQSRRRMVALFVWALVTLAATFAKDTALATPAVVAWLACTVGLPIVVLRTNRAVDAKLRTATAVGRDGETTSAYAASKRRMRDQVLCAVTAVCTYGMVGGGLATLLDTRSDDTSWPVALVPFVVGIAAAVVAYRALRNALDARSR